MPKKPPATSLDPCESVAQELAQVSNSLETIRASNNRIEALLKILAQPVLQSRLKHVFRDGRQLRVYELSDGKRSTRELGKAVGVDQKTVSRWWRAWDKDYRIVDKAGKRGQFRARYSLWELIALLPDATADETRQTGTPDEALTEQRPLL